jgi:prophage maintenance system killer protein
MNGDRGFDREVATREVIHGRTESPQIREFTRVPNRPFADGNKRTGFVVGILFLELNGYRFRASEEDAAQALLELAGNIDEMGYTAFPRANAKRGNK